MDSIENILELIKDCVWATPLLALLLGTGLYLTFVLKGVQFRYFFFAIKEVFAPKMDKEKGDISHFEALMTTLAGAIGTGNIVGVTTAITIGGFGALFWMWVTAFLGMATKYSESLLAVKYRVEDRRKEMVGGPMEYIERGLGWKKLALAFAFFGAIAAIGTGNLVQVNSIAEAINTTLFQVSPWVVGVILACCVGVVLLGGVKSIGHVAGILVPLMASLYVGGGLFILILNWDKIPQAFILIVKSAFSTGAVSGGVMGATVASAIQMGVARSIFSNEAGLGISSIAAAAAKTDSPARQGLISMTGGLLSTVIVCTITGLVLAVTDVMNTSSLTGASLAIKAFSHHLIGGQFIVSIGLVLFAYSTVVAWAYYGEKCFEYLFGEQAVIWYRILYTLIVIPGAAIKMEMAWLVADITNGLMAIPNLIALIMLSKVISKETDRFVTLIGKKKDKTLYSKTI